jgi:hypothetical protein
VARAREPARVVVATVAMNVARDTLAAVANAAGAGGNGIERG